VSRIILLPGAQRDLLRLRAFLEEKAPEAAGRVGPAIKAALHRLVQFPESAPPSLQPPIRQFHIPFGQAGYLAGYVYDEAADTVFVVSIRHEKELPASPGTWPV
jgi:plasmid stabilization system protein ParE